MRTIAIENGEAKLTKQQMSVLTKAADLLRGLQQVYFRDVPRRDLLIDAEDAIRRECGDGKEEDAS